VGKPFRPDVAEAFFSLIGVLEPDLVVVAGDLTQRAKRREYETVQTLLAKAGPVPLVVTPGNHDVPLYRFWERLIDPYRNWRRYVSADLDTVTRVPGATVVALNSSAPRRAIVAGRVRDEQVALARSAFSSLPEDEARLLVIHHHFVPTPDRKGGAPLPGAEKLLGEFEAMGVDVVLGGHVHQTHLSTSRALVPGEGEGIPLVACGTTASSRGRGPESDANSLNVVRLHTDVIEVTPHRFDTASGVFRPRKAHTFPRRGVHSAPSPQGGGAT
jgi:3',5'-cyclic AMP phosphodiesterase CpdA